MRRKIRYAVVGLGHINQVAVLPAFAHARANSELAALISGDAVKRRALGRRHRVPTFDYEEYESALSSAGIDAVYIGLPNHQHAEYAIRAARAGVHVLCEKPMAVTSRDCARMIRAADGNRVWLMIAYRLHFEAATLDALRLARSGRLGELRFFHSAFSMQVKAGDVRVQRATGGGALYDLGVYCIQAARMLFGADPVSVFAASASRSDPRFREVDEMTSAVLRFPGERLAVFTCSFGAGDVSSYRLVGTRGDLHVEPAYEYRQGLAHTLRIGERSQRRRFPNSDQFAPELLHFSNCILQNRPPEPSGREGMVDVRIIEALLRSARSGSVVALSKTPRRGDRAPSPTQVRRLPPVRKPRLVRTESASR
jgi:predicted dehydrogenase